MDKALHISKAFLEYIKEVEYRYQMNGEPLGLSTGIERLDERLGYIRGGDVVLIAGRPAMGKTAFAINCVYQVAQKFKEEAEQNNSEMKQVLYFDFECNNKNIMQRFVSLASGIPLYELRHDIENYKQFEKIALTGNEINQLPIYLCNQISSISDIRDKIYAFANRNKLGLVVIDYLQLLPLYSEDKSNQAYKKFMQDIKSISEKLDVPILILSQLNRNLEQRQCKIPINSDIGGYRNIVPYADKLLFLYRESYYMYDKEPKRYKRETIEHFEKRYKEWQEDCQEQKNKCEIIIAKNNNGTCGRIKCLFDLGIGKFSNLEEDCF